MKNNFEILPIFFDIEKLQQATNKLFTEMSWKQHIVKGLCMTQIPGDPSSADGDKLRGVFWTKPDSTGEEVQREKDVDESQYTEFVEEFKGTYFETVYNFPASGAISLSDASDPSAARIAEIAARIKNEDIKCVLSEPQFNAGLVKTVMGGTDAITRVIDPIGFGIEPGPSLYPELIRGMAKSLVDCLK